MFSCPHRTLAHCFSTLCQGGVPEVPLAALRAQGDMGFVVGAGLGRQGGGAEGAPPVAQPCLAASPIGDPQKMPCRAGFQPVLGSSELLQRGWWGGNETWSSDEGPVGLSDEFNLGLQTKLGLSCDTNRARDLLASLHFLHQCCGPRLWPGFQFLEQSCVDAADQEDAVHRARRSPHVHWSIARLGGGGGKAPDPAWDACELQRSCGSRHGHQAASLPSAHIGWGASGVCCEVPSQKGPTESGDNRRGACGVGCQVPRQERCPDSRWGGFGVCHEVPFQEGPPHAAGGGIFKFQRTSPLFCFNGSTVVRRGAQQRDAWSESPIGASPCSRSGGAQCPSSGRGRGCSTLQRRWEDQDGSGAGKSCAS